MGAWLGNYVSAWDGINFARSSYKDTMAEHYRVGEQQERRQTNFAVAVNSSHVVNEEGWCASPHSCLFSLGLAGFHLSVKPCLLWE